MITIPTRKEVTTSVVEKPSLATKAIGCMFGMALKGYCAYREAAVATKVLKYKFDLEKEQASGEIDERWQHVVDTLSSK